MFGPAVTTEAHLAFSGARAHSNNTAEMTAMIEALSSLGPRGPVARDSNSCIFEDSQHAASVCLGARFKPAHMFNWHLHVSGRRYAPNTSYGLPCSTCPATLGTWVMNVLIMPPLLGHLALCPVTTLLRVGLVITLMPLLVSVLATTLAKTWKNYVTY